MSNMMGKIGEKLHMGGQHKEEERLHTTAPGQAGVYQPAHAGEGVGVGHAPVAGAQPQHEGAMAKIKNKVKGGKKGSAGGDSSSSSSSESDGEGGRRKRNLGAKKVGVF